MRTSYDYIIVGGGSAGCVLANRLSARSDLKVLLLEAGGEEKGLLHQAPAAFYKLFKTEADWAFYTEPQENLAGRELYWPRGKVLGGSSAINAMIYIRGNPYDYDAWGQPGWGYREVLPYFRRMETHPLGPSEYHGDSGPLNVEVRRYTNLLSHAFVEAGVQAGLRRNDDFNGPHQEGVGLLHVTCKNGQRHSTYSAYLKPVLHRPNLTVLTGARVHRVLLERTRATGVEVRYQGALHTLHAERGVILAAGAVQSPQLLMLSGIGPADHLRRHGLEPRLDLPVGQNLWDHLALPVIWRCKKPVSLDDAVPLGNVLRRETPRSVAEAQALVKNLPEAVRFALTHNGLLTSNIAEAGAFLRVLPGAPAPDLQFHFGPAYFANHGFTHPQGHYFTIGPTLVGSRSRGFIELKSADPEAAPRIQPRYLSAEEDLEVLLRGLELAREIAGQPAFDPYRGEEVHPGATARTRGELEAYVRQNAQTLYHPAGTCSMGQVVDERLKVLGAENLFVADASVMPGVVRGNTNAPAIMIGEKAADLLLAQA
ncbi:MAG: choline dehydrogenase [Armatimonadota bacterium]